MAALRPGTSPPPVRIPMCLGAMAISFPGGGFPRIACTCLIYHDRRRMIPPRKRDKLSHRIHGDALNATVPPLQVRPILPEPLKALEDIAYNLRWSWDHETIGLFRRLDQELWETSGHNPVLMLSTIPQERLHEAAQDETFLVQLDRVRRDLESYM